MKFILTFLILLTSITSFGQTTYQQWEKQASENIRLRPKYGNVEKTNQQNESDKIFVDEAMKNEKFNGDKRLASNYMISVGFQYFYNGDLKTAMYRFNQAYLLDKENTDIFWGYGAVYMALSRKDKAKDQYEEGLAINPKNAHLLTDLGTYYLSNFYENNSSSKQAKEDLHTAINYLTQSYANDAKDQNTLYKLSICYFMNNDCVNARKFYEECIAVGGNPITKEYTAELNKMCK